MHSIGFLIKDIDVSQQSCFLGRSISNVLPKNPAVDIIIFQQSLIRPPMQANFAILHEKELWSFSGTVISTNLELTQNLMECPGPTKKIYYVTDIEWSNNPNYHFIQELLKEVDLIAENQTLYDILSLYLKKPLGIAKNYNVEEMLKLI